MPKSYEIVPNTRRGGWDVRADSGRRLASNHSTVEAALASAARYVKNARGGSVLVRATDGRTEVFEWSGGELMLVPGDLNSPAAVGPL